MRHCELARRVYAVCHLTGRFILRSGSSSDEYFDKYLLEADPCLLKSLAEGMVGIIPNNCEMLAGLEMGGIPVATVLSQLTGLPTVFVRKQAKEYGTCKLAEGPAVVARRLVVVEDVVTSGGQIVASTKQLRELGARVDDVICVIDRESGALENLKQEGLTLRALFTMSELERCADSQ